MFQALHQLGSSLFPLWSDAHLTVMGLLGTIMVTFLVTCILSRKAKGDTLFGGYGYLTGATFFRLLSLPFFWNALGAFLQAESQSSAQDTSIKHLVDALFLRAAIFAVAGCYFFFRQQIVTILVIMFLWTKKALHQVLFDAKKRNANKTYRS